MCIHVLRYMSMRCGTHTYMYTWYTVFTRYILEYHKSFTRMGDREKTYKASHDPRDQRRIQVYMVQ